MAVKQLTVADKNTVESQLKSGIQMNKAPLLATYSLEIRGNLIKLKIPKEQKAQRDSILQDVNNWLVRLYNIDANFNPNPGPGHDHSGSIEFPGSRPVFRIVCKVEGGNSGSDSWQTALQESGQCYYCAAAWYKKQNEPFSDATIRKYAGYVNAYESLKGGKVLGVDTVLGELSDEWKNTCVAIAERLAIKYKSKMKNAKFHRLSPLVKQIEDTFKVINDSSGKIFTDVNKWNPADIWIESGFDTGQLNAKVNTFDKLNGIIKNALINENLLPISLKAVEDIKSVQLLEVNFSQKVRPTYSYSSYTFGKRGVMGSQDVFLFAEQNTGYNGKKLTGGNHAVEMQFRTFGTTWQSEAKGIAANQGKCSGGPIERIFNDVAKGTKRLTLPSAATITTNSAEIFKKKPKNYRGPKFSKFAQEFYSMMQSAEATEGRKGLRDQDKVPKTIDEFYRAIGNKENPSGYVKSKYFGIVFINKFIALSPTEKSAVVNEIINYAKSQSSLSCPHLKCT